jgi:hypothetical protein
MDWRRRVKENNKNLKREERKMYQNKGENFFKKHVTGELALVQLAPRGLSTRGGCVDRSRGTAHIAEWRTGMQKKSKRKKQQAYSRGIWKGKRKKQQRAYSGEVDEGKKKKKRRRRRGGRGRARG